MTELEGFREIYGDQWTFKVAPEPPPRLGNYAFHGLDQIEEVEPSELDDELIIGEEFVTYLLYKPDCVPESFSLVAHEGYIEIVAGEMTVKKNLEVKVDSEVPEVEYGGGVLSVKLRRILGRDGVA